MENDVAAVVVTYNSERHVGALLDSIPAALGPLSYSVVVVDNGSLDGTRALLADRADCITVHSTNEGYAAGVNRAVRASPPARFVLILNPDAELDPLSIFEMAQVFRRHRAVGIVAPRVREADGSLSPTLRRGPTIARVGGLSFTGLAAFAERIEDEEAYAFEHPAEWAVGAVLLVSSQMFQELGGLDESYFLYSEETEFCLKAMDRGWATWYTPDAGAMHIGGGSGESSVTHTMKIINRVRLYRRRNGPALAVIYYVLIMLIELRRAIFGHPWSWATLQALLRPSRRPEQLGASSVLIPR